MSSKSKGNTDFLAYALAAAVSQQKKEIKTRGAGVLDLSAPTPPDWWNGDAQFAGLVPREDQEKDMEILIDEWSQYADEGDSDTLQFQWKASASSTWQDAQAPIEIPGPHKPGDFPMALMLSKENFQTEGTFNLRYYVTLWNGTTTYSETAQFIIDKTPPNANQSPSPLTFFDDVVVEGGVTGDYLEENEGVEIVIPSYSDKRLGDSIELYVHNEDVTPTAPVFRSGLDASLQLKVPTSAFDTLKDGMIYFYYRLVDKVGNRGPVSDNAETGLFINPLPAPPLAAPQVPRIEDDGVLNLQDVLAGENLVEIPLYGNWLEGDQVVLTWGSSRVKVFHDVTSSQDPMVLIVPYKTILAPAYGDAAGKLPTAISYDVIRGNRRFGSAVTTIEVDFFVPGPVNPDRPNPVNPKLPVVTVQGTGSTPTDNVLNEDDANLPVNVTVDLYDPIGQGEQMVLYWSSIDHKVGTYTPDPASDKPGDAYTFTVAWNDIKDLQSSAEVPVFYTVGLVSGEGNIEACTPTLVDVTAALPIILAAPEFPDAFELPNGELILNCASYLGSDQHVNVTIPGNSPLLSGGETLTFSWQCYSNRLGTVPVGSPIITTKTITAAEATNGFTQVFTPFNTHILPVGSNGSVRLSYTSGTTPPMQGELLIRASNVNAEGVCKVQSRRLARHSIQENQARTYP